MAAGVVAEDGIVRCGCGKRVGEVSAEGVSFWCPSCRQPVEVRFAEMKLNGLVQAVAALNSAVSGINTVAGLLAQMQMTG